MKKTLAALLSIAMLGVSSLSASAYWTQDGSIICVVTAVREDSCCFLDDNIVLYQSEIDEYAEEPFTPSCGDVVQVRNTAICDTDPAQLDWISEDVLPEIEYLGKAEDYFKDNIKEMTVVSNDNCCQLVLEDAEKKQYRMWYDANGDRGYIALGYQAAIDYNSFEPGDKGLFVVSPKGDYHLSDGTSIGNVMVAVSGPLGKTEPEATMGDADGNGSVDILDVVTANKIILGKYKATDAEYEAADVDGNGVVEPADSLNIMKLVVGLEVNF